MKREILTEFSDAVWDYYRRNGRSMPWREDPSPYAVLVSEVMLQQTQVDRVRPKFALFMERFPTIQSLAEAPLADVLTIWSGLGYNRRAKFLWQAAQMVMKDFGGTMPQTLEGLQKLPGVGANTAGAIMAYAHNEPVVFVETNIRTVLFHHFYPDSTEVVSDAQLRELVAQTLDKEHPREWYWALMDYGTHLKKTAGGRLAQSKHYIKQSPLKGSVREMRGRILKELTRAPQKAAILPTIVMADDRYEPAMSALKAERLIQQKGEWICLTDK